MSLRIYGNRLLKTLPGLDTRPTPARVREALFNIWQGTIPDCHWLDLCTGCGAMGAEALGRGAASVTGIEQSGKACAVIHQNWQQIARSPQKFHLLRGDVRKQLPKLSGQQFDRIYFDPPYASDLYQPVLDAIATLHLLHPEGELATEHGSDRALPQCISSTGNQAHGIMVLEQYRAKTYGSTSITFYRLTTRNLL
ncbi:MAG: 16S rRNA (guanine(966)-N(2))-methyltransferase RsmD [Cyanothece sp. SIO2G6]|nr:16S rRNA (guanine(966)-N(2))-methyltransferase RsmD [Cyanothece sp. SIO2G6]